MSYVRAGKGLLNYSRPYVKKAADWIGKTFGNAKTVGGKVVTGTVRGAGTLGGGILGGGAYQAVNDAVTGSGEESSQSPVTPISFGQVAR